MLQLWSPWPPLARAGGSCLSCIFKDVYTRQKHYLQTCAVKSLGISICRNVLHITFPFALVSGTKIYSSIKKTKTHKTKTTTSMHQNCRTSIRFPQEFLQPLAVSQVIMEPIAEHSALTCAGPGERQPRALACSGSGAGLRNNSVPRKAALTLMPYAHNGQFLLRSSRGKPACALWCSGPAERRRAKRAARRPGTVSAHSSFPTSQFSPKGQRVPVLSLERKHKRVNEGERPLPQGCW